MVTVVNRFIIQKNFHSRELRKILGIFNWEISSVNACVSDPNQWSVKKSMINSFNLNVTKTVH